MNKIIFSVLIIGICLFAMSKVNAQEPHTFDYQIVKVDSLSYTISMDLKSPENVQFIEVRLMKKGSDVGYYMASLNKKRDGKYYLFYDNNEWETSLNEMVFTVKDKYGLPTVDEVLINLMTEDFNMITSKSQPVH